MKDLIAWLIYVTAGVGCGHCSWCGVMTPFSAFFLGIAVGISLEMLLLVLSIKEK